MVTISSKKPDVYSERTIAEQTRIRDLNHLVVYLRRAVSPVLATPLTKGLHAKFDQRTEHYRELYRDAAERLTANSAKLEKWKQTTAGKIIPNLEASAAACASSKMAAKGAYRIPALRDDSYRASMAEGRLDKLSVGKVPDLTRAEWAELRWAQRFQRRKYRDLERPLSPVERIVRNAIASAFKLSA